MEETAKVKEVKLTKEEAESLIRLVVDSFSDAQKQNLLENIKAGRRLHCGNKASIFSDENAGCMITLATTTDLPEHKLDIQKKSLIDLKAMELYLKVIETHTLRYYIATAMMEEEPFKELILNSLQAA